MQRPRPGECSGSFLGYTEEVPGDDPLAALETQLEETVDLLAGLDEDRARLRYAPGKWSVKEVVGHLCDGERILTARGLWFARGDGRPQPGFDEEAFVAASDLDLRPLPDLVAELVSVRAATLTLFRGLSGRELERSGTANGEPLVVRAVPWILAGHELHHRGTLRERYGL